MKWGRAYSLALWAIILASVVEAACVIALFGKTLPPDPFSEITGSYLLMLTAIGAGVQLPSAAEKMPGHRSYDPGAPGRVAVSTDTPEAG